QELIAAALVDVEQGDPRSVQALAARGEWLGHSPALVEWAHVIHGTSFEMTSASMPRQGPNTAEKRPASPPATTITMSSGCDHLPMSRSSSEPFTSGVVSPQRSDAAGRLADSNIASRTCCLLQPHSANERACSGHRTN